MLCVCFQDPVTYEELKKEIIRNNAIINKLRKKAEQQAQLTNLLSLELFCLQSYKPKMKKQPPRKEAFLKNQAVGS